MPFGVTCLNMNKYYSLICSYLNKEFDCYDCCRLSHMTILFYNYITDAARENMMVLKTFVSMTPEDPPVCGSSE